MITDSDGKFIKEGIDFNPDNEMMVRTPFPRDENGQIGFWAPKWDGEKWIETGQAPEPTPREPTELELLMLAISELDVQRELDRTENQVAIAELAESLIGGF